jgi:hypothetical protein
VGDAPCRPDRDDQRRDVVTAMFVPYEDRTPPPPPPPQWWGRREDDGLARAIAQVVHEWCMICVSEAREAAIGELRHEAARLRAWRIAREAGL